MKIVWDSEKELAKVIVDHLRDEGWTVYPELNDIDIVAAREDVSCKNGLRVIGVECKKYFNLTVLEQAHKKRHDVDEMYVGVSDGWDHSQHFGCHLAKLLGYGVYLVNKQPDYKGGFQYSLKKRLDSEFRPRKNKIDSVFHPTAENFAEAGQSGGKHWSLFQKTCFLISEYVKENPGLTLREVVKAVPNHYAGTNSACSALRKAIFEGWLEVKYEGKKLYPK